MRKRPPKRRFIEVDDESHLCVQLLAAANGESIKSITSRLIRDYYRNERPKMVFPQ